MGHHTLEHYKLPKKSGEKFSLGHLYGCSKGYALVQAAESSATPILAITPDMRSAARLYDECQFFASNARELNIMVFPDWETLPFDSFSPHQDIISERLSILNRLHTLKRWLIIIPVSTLMHRMQNPAFLQAHSFVMNVGDTIEPRSLSASLTKNGYHHVSQVMEHGEFSLRGAVMDIFPMGSNQPYRLDLFDDEIDSIRLFDTETQRSQEKIPAINLLPAKEYPLNDEGITRFRQQWRARFEGNPANSPLYQDISEGRSSPGVEYYLPLFFEQTSTLFDFLPEHTCLALVDDVHGHAEQFWQEVRMRHEQLCGDIERPLLPANEVFLPGNELFALINQRPVLELKENAAQHVLGVAPPSHITLHHQAEQPYRELLELLQDRSTRFLILAESAGRREVLLDTLHKIGLMPKTVTSWHAFLDADTEPLCISVAPLEAGLALNDPKLQIITEAQLYGSQIRQRARANKGIQDPAAIIRNLTELTIGAPVVHVEQGIGRYHGLVTLTTGDVTGEYLLLVYANDSKLYVPVADLHLISRYTGSEHAPLHPLGSNKWAKIKEKAAKRVRDVAAELLNIYAQRAAKPGHAFHLDAQAYDRFAASFPFEETPDQAKAIADVLADLQTPHAMDRLVCGDVGFGKTEVAMRAAFMVAMNQRQVAVLVPTTLLCEQHFKNFQDRFADWPIRVAAVSRFRSKKEQEQIVADIQNGKIDIVIGTHKLLQSDFEFNALGLLIIDEEHRFGVRQKEKIKSLRANVDILTLTATPIPRTLNMSMTGMRDLSIIATPPARRLSVVTFVRRYQTSLIREAVLREILRGGQVYFLHNDVQSIERVALDLEQLLPEAKTGVAHGQMPEKQLEQVMADFYHRRFNILVSTTIIESGIDIPSANTMIINRADKFGLAQLHQLRGRVGRSHHQAYAYLLTPEESAMTKDAKKRLEAISALEDLGSGFALATNDLEIRGAGEILGDEQSGHIQEMGFSLYMEMLDSAVTALKSGVEPDDLMPTHNGPHVDLLITALIPEDLIPDVKLRLSLYKRLANAASQDDLDDLKAELIDRFGLLPEPTQHLFKQTALKLQIKPMGITQLQVNGKYVYLGLAEKPQINVPQLIQLVQKNPAKYRLSGNDQIRYTLDDTTPKGKFNEIQQFIAQLSTNPS